MDANQFQALVIAWGASLTTLIGVVLGLALALRGAISQIFTQHGKNAVAIAQLATQSAVHAEQLNGSLVPRIQQIVDSSISQHHRAADTPPA